MLLTVEKGFKAQYAMQYITMLKQIIVWYLEKEIRCDIETLPIDRELNKKHFYGKIMQKMCLKS